ncbi:MAG: HlyC/CorC family transporter [Deltaproteobacteria bacterium]|nr:HlyC/CorC family transporter [Deltaproteobacteria bacterium]
MDGYGTQGFLIAVLIVLSAVFSASETALLALGPAGVHQILDEERRRSGLLRLWRDRPNQVLASLLIANNLVNILASAVATALTADVLEHRGVGDALSWAVAVAVGAMTFLLVVFGEVLPKTFAKHNARSMVALFPVTLVFCQILRPFAFVLQKATGWMISSAGGSVGGDGQPEVTEAEIETMIRLGTAQGALTGEKRDLLSSVIEFSETMTKEIMVPRTDVVGFPVQAALPEVLGIVAEKRFSRYPVYEEDLDSIVGIVTVKDLFEAISKPGEAPFTLGHLGTRRRTLFVPETKKIGDLLKEFQRERVQMAVAVDEFGGTAGIVTMEDVIEEIVGEIYDEFDQKAEPHVKKVEDERYVVQARTPIEEMAETFGLDLPEQDIYETVGGLVMTHAGRVPAAGDVVTYAGLRFEVKERTRTRILSLVVSREAAGGGAGGD